jgi:hypothetical protein
MIGSIDPRTGWQGLKTERPELVKEVFRAGNAQVRILDLAYKTGRGRPMKLACPFLFVR